MRQKHENIHKLDVYGGVCPHCQKLFSNDYKVKRHIKQGKHTIDMDIQQAWYSLLIKKFKMIVKSFDMFKRSFMFSLIFGCLHL